MAVLCVTLSVPVEIPATLEERVMRHVLDAGASDPGAYALRLLTWAFLAREHGNVAFDEAHVQHTNTEMAKMFDEKLACAERQYNDDLARMGAEHKAELARTAAEAERVQSCVKLLVDERTRTLIDSHVREIQSLERMHHHEVAALNTNIARLIEEASVRCDLDKARVELNAIRTGSSRLKGIETERELARVFEQVLDNATVELCGKTAHVGDIHIVTPSGRILVECKNKQVVTHEDIDKYIKDVVNVAQTCGDLIGSVFVCVQASRTRISMSVVGGFPSLNVHCSELSIVGQIIGVFFDLCVQLAKAKAAAKAKAEETKTEPLEYDTYRDEKYTEEVVERIGAKYTALIKTLVGIEKNARSILNSATRVMKSFGELQTEVISALC